MTTELLDEIGASDHDPRLRTSEQLVPGETNKVCAPCQARTCGRLVTDVDQRARAEIVDERQVVTVRDVRQFAPRRLRSEADEAEVGLMNAQQDGGLCTDRCFIVGGARAVRRSDFAQR